MNQQVLHDIIHYINDYGRPIDQARLRYLVLGEGLDDVIRLLTTYQNPDGGFHSLEPDLWSPHSNQLASWTAINILREIPFDSLSPMILKFFYYLEESFNQANERWMILDPKHNDYPHAPWWTYREEMPSFNPSASIAGFILKHSNPLGKAFKYANKVARQAIDFINDTQDPIEPHELRCLIEMMDDINDLFGHYAPYKKAKNRLILQIDQAIEKNQSKWFTSYCTKPTQLISSHPGFGSQLYFDDLVDELSLSVDHRNEYGVWSITWDWSKDYPDAYKDAKRQWEGIQALNYLRWMIQLGMIEKET